MQDGDEEDSCTWTRKMWSPTRKSSQGAWRLTEPTLEALAAQWRALSEHDRPVRLTVTRADVKANVVVKQVASLVAGDPWKIHEPSLIVKECYSGARRSFFRTFEFDS